jgi:two-component system nitrate/nitrite sensor histidine kinase NarX
MSQMLGYSEEEILQHTVSDFFLSQEVRSEMMQRLDTEKTVQITPLQLRRKDGTIFFVTLTESKIVVGDQFVLLEVLNDITDRIQAEEAHRAEAERAAIAEERNRIARDLHDSVTQALYTTSLIAEALPAVWETRPDEARQSLQNLRRLTQGALGEMRTLLLELRPGELADRTLSVLLRQLTEAMSARTSLPITMTDSGHCELPTQVHVAMYRIGQEALNNVVKHARAQHAWINLACNDQTVTLIVRDDGRGFNNESILADRMGVRIMRERAESAGVDLVIDSLADHGTVIRATWHSIEKE